jgi:iron complex outermembrane receptor protein
MAEKTWNRFSLFINFENFTDTRFSKKIPKITNGTATHPSGFSEIYGPTDGRVINGGLKISL